MPLERNSSNRSSSAALSLSLRLAVGSSRIRSLHLLGQRLGDLHQLLLADPDIGDQRVRRLIEAHLRQQLLATACRPRRDRSCRTATAGWR